MDEKVVRVDSPWKNSLAIQEVNPWSLLPHERYDEKQVLELTTALKEIPIIVWPILVDRQSHTILDGHHRVEACRRLNWRLLPCKMVDYLMDNSIRVYSRRLGVVISKEIVLTCATNRDLLPTKSTRHEILNSGHRWIC